MFEQIPDAKGVMSQPWFPYAGVLGLSVWGGLTRYFNEKEAFTWRGLTAQLLSSSFAGFMTYMACQYAHVNGPLTGVLCGVASHLGTPALIQLAMKLKVVKNLLAENTTK